MGAILEALLQLVAALAGSETRTSHPLIIVGWFLACLAALGLIAALVLDAV